MDGYDGTHTAGRKGIAYDWRALVSSSEFAAVDESAEWLTDEAISRFIDGAVAR